jgi:fluoride ion exporter CrcB/FEX
MAERNGSLLDMAIDFAIENIVHIIGFVLGVSAKWAIRYKAKSDDMRAYIYDGVIAAAATFLTWQFLKYINRTDLIAVAIFISARYGDAMINIIWIKFKEIVAGKSTKTETNE